MNQIQVGSQLTYQVNAPATFLFNISVSRNSFQRIVAESLEIFPFRKIEECAVGDLGNRMIRSKFTFEMSPLNPTDTELREGYSIGAFRDAGGITYRYELSSTGVTRTLPGADPDAQ